MPHPPSTARRRHRAIDLTGFDEQHQFTAHLDFEGPHAVLPPTSPRGISYSIGQCHLWSGSKDAAGYGRVWLGVQGWHLAHRLAWELTKKPIPPGFTIEHRCRTKACVRLSHLRLVHRHEVGGSHVPHAGSSKLTPAQVADLRRQYASGVTQAALAAAFKCSQPTVSRLVVGLTRGTSAVSATAPAPAGPGDYKTAFKDPRRPGAKVIQQRAMDEVWRIYNEQRELRDVPVIPDCDRPAWAARLRKLAEFWYTEDVDPVAYIELVHKHARWRGKFPDLSILCGVYARQKWRDHWAKVADRVPLHAGKHYRKPRTRELLTRQFPEVSGWPDGQLRYVEGVAQHIVSDPDTAPTPTAKWAPYITVVVDAIRAGAVRFL